MGIIHISLFYVVIHMKTLLWCLECDVFLLHPCDFTAMSIDILDYILYQMNFCAAISYNVT